MSKGAYINEEGTLVIDMAEADKLWNSLTKDQQFAAMSAMFDPLLERAKELSEEVEAQAARIRELEAAQGEGMYGEYTPITVRSARVLLGCWLSGDFEESADAMADDAIIDQWAHVDRTYPDAAPIIETWLRALAGQGGE